MESLISNFCSCCLYYNIVNRVIAVLLWFWFFSYYEARYVRQTGKHYNFYPYGDIRENKICKIIANNMLTLAVPIEIAQQPCVFHRLSPYILP